MSHRAADRPSVARASRGSVLMLMPAAVLIVLLLGGIAVDAAVVFLEQRQAYNVAFDAANDAAGAGIDRDVVRTTGEFVYDPVRVRQLARAAIAASGADGLTLVSAAPTGDGAVAVTVDVRVRRLFGQAFGAASSETIRITARATAEIRMS